MAEDNLIFQAEEEKSKDIQKLDELAAQSERILYKVGAVFPFQFFPDELIIDESKVSLITKRFIASAQVRSLVYENIFNIVLDYSVFFAQIKIYESSFADQPFEIDFLPKERALTARRIIQGLVIVKQENIDMAELSIKEVLERVEQLGKARE